MVLGSEPVTLLDQLHIPSGRGYSVLRFLLKDMEQVDRSLEPHRVDRAIGTTIEAFNHFQNARPSRLSAMEERSVPP